MKKWILIGAGVVALAGLSWAGVWAWNNLRGAGPAIKKPPVDIREVINTDENPLVTKGGFRISIFAEDFEKPRDLFFSNPSLYVSDTDAGKVYELIDENHDGKIEDETEKRVLLEGLNHPHGIAANCGVGGCTFYVAEENALMEYAFLDGTETRKKLADLPSGGKHTTRSILRLDDSGMLISIGSSCNVCKETDATRASIQLVNLETGEMQPYATGLRNSVFIIFSPSGDIWATEMGRDELGDDLPPDEINIINSGQFYGWPYCYGKRVQDADFDASAEAAARCADSVAPRLAFQAHSAPLGLTFVPEDSGWPEYTLGDLLVAYHGSWNRTEPTGYKIVRFNINAEEDTAPNTENDFITGWLTPNNDALGRPVDLEFGTDGTLYISDDKAGVIYRLIYGDAAAPQGVCRPTGCSGQICSDEDVISTCEYAESAACYKDATCERQASGECGWTLTPNVIQCLEATGGVVEE